jgi:hypothetical protein
MAVDPAALASLATHYAKDMTSIRGRRVQRLLKREFAGADYVLLARLASGASAVVGLSPTGAALCATDGTGRHASVLKWSHGAVMAFETQFDLLKDSLPALETAAVPLGSLRALGGAPWRAQALPAEARPLLDQVLRAPG